MPGKVMLYEDYSRVLRTDYGPRILYDCGKALRPDLSEVMLTKYEYYTLGSTLGGGDFECDVPWEISLPFVEKSFSYALARTREWIYWRDITCQWLAERQVGYESDVDFVFTGEE